jgi:hypothetical protein
MLRYRRFAPALSSLFVCACVACRSAPAPSPTADPSAGVAEGVGGLRDRDGALDPSVISPMSESEAQTEPTLAVTSDGRIAVAWVSGGAEADAANTANTAIGVRLSKDGGASWTSVQSIRSPDARTATDPVLAADAGGNLYLAWLAAGPDGPGGVPDSHIYVARAEAPGSVFGPAVDLSERMHRGAKLAKPWLAATSNGAVVATWAYGSSLGDGIGIARSTDGRSWTKGSVLERVGLRASLPYLCASGHGDRLWVAYLDSEAGVRVRASDDGGINWSPGRGTTVSTTEERPRIANDAPVCVGEAEEVTVAYGLAHDPRSASSLESIVLAKSYDGGRVFDSRRVLDGGGVAMMHPQIAREYDGAIDLAYYAAGATPEAGALRWTRAESDHAPLGLGLSHVGRPSFRFEPARDKRAWPGDYFGWAWRAGTLYAASSDNAGEITRVAFTRIAIK